MKPISIFGGLSLTSSILIRSLVLPTLWLVKLESRASMKTSKLFNKQHSIKIFSKLNNQIYVVKNSFCLNNDIINFMFIFFCKWAFFFHFSWVGNEWLGGGTGPLPSSFGIPRYNCPWLDPQLWKIILSLVKVITSGIKTLNMFTICRIC